MEIVYVLQVGHRHGSETWVAYTEKDAIEALANYCREWWDDNNLLAVPPPDTDKEVIEQYFAANEDEDYEIFQRGVIGAPSFSGRSIVRG